MKPIILLAALLSFPSAVAAGVETAAPAPFGGAAVKRFLPRGAIVEAPLDERGLVPVGVTHLMVSTGSRLVPWDSEEGLAIQCEMAVNVDARCRIRHRVFHRPTR